MPKAKTHRRKKMAMELLCSSSAAPLLGKTGSEGVVEVWFVTVVFGAGLGAVVVEEVVRGVIAGGRGFGIGAIEGAGDAWAGCAAGELASLVAFLATLACVELP